MQIVRRFFYFTVALFFCCTCFLSSACAAIYRDHLASGGGRSTAEATQVTWSALGETFGGMMSGGGYIVQTHGGDIYGNEPANITDFKPATKSRLYQGNITALSVTVTDPDKDALKIRFLLDGQLLQDWSISKIFSWIIGTTSFGWHTLRVEVKDKYYTVMKESRVFIFWRPPQ